MSLTASSSATVIPLRTTDRAVSTPVRDREAARRFLHLLDPAAQDFTFQTFHDRHNGLDLDGSLARNTPDRAEVLRLYKRGAGVYVTVNETDLTGRKRENIKRIRAIWQEDARAEPQVIRLALVYALLDCSHQIDVVHLEAAMAVWAYCEESATRIFGDSLGDPVADEILLALRRSGSMTRTDIHHLFGRHRPADQIGIALALLLKTGRAKFETRQTGGRPVETWSAI